MLNGNQDQKITPMTRLAVGAGAVVLLVASIAIASAIGKHSARNNSALQKEVVETVKAAPELAIGVDNSESPPLMIESASVKEVTSLEYQQLTGTQSASGQYVTFPNVKLLNNTNQTVTAFVLVLEDKRSPEHDGLAMTALKIEPFKDFAVESMDWAKPKKKMVKKYIASGGVVQEDNREPGLDTEYMWLPGRVGDFSVLVGMVEFADGSKWMTKR